LTRIGLQSAVVADGVHVYKGVAALLDGNVYDDKGKRSLAPIVKATGWNKSTLSKAITVVEFYMPTVADMSADEIRNAVLALLDEHGSLSALYLSVVGEPTKEPTAWQVMLANVIGVAKGQGATDQEISDKVAELLG